MELDQGEPILSFENYDALWVMGGPMDVWDSDEYPWLIPEKAAIRKWVYDLKKPYFGLCLGHQLLADALGGICGPQNPPEIGVLTIKLTDDGKTDPLFHGTPGTQKCLQWHSVRVVQPPENTTILASSDLCSVQAMRVGSNAWSMQYHVEVEPITVANWADVPAYHKVLMNTLGEAGYELISNDVDESMDEFLSCAETLYRNFISLTDNELGDH